ncbi:MAG: PAS domain-containing protein [bacterium]
MTDTPHQPEALPAGHPLEIFLAENRALTAAVAELRSQLLAISEATDPEGDGLVARWREASDRLQEVGRHYQRKERCYFAHLEKYGFIDPARDMWRLDDDIRKELRNLTARLQETHDPSGWQELARSSATLLLDMIEAMIIAEEQGLLPHCSDRFTPVDWVEIHQESVRFGYCLVTPGQDFQPPPLPPHRPYLHGIDNVALRLSSGQLTPHQLEGIFASLPVDLTFSDHEDRIVFYSDPPQRLFNRSPAIIGRPLVNCHPPAAEQRLARLMDDLRSGRKDKDEGVHDVNGRRIRIQYLAVRDGEGEYIGCLETAQDITALSFPEGHPEEITDSEELSA